MRDPQPSVPAAGISALVAANTATAIDLYHQLAATPGNVFFSPYSIATALTMAAVGARGETLTQMLALLHNDRPTDTLHVATNALDLALLAPRPVPRGITADPLALKVANSVWAQTGYHVEPDFVAVLARDYGAALNTADFARDAAAATAVINDWVDTNTNHKIRNLLSELDASTRLVLVNAVYFKGSWLSPFEPEQTRPGPFTTDTGATVTVPFMHRTVGAGYASGDGWLAVDVAYVGDASMTMIVPDAGTFPAFERDLDASGVTRVVAALESAEVVLSMPKIEITDRCDLGAVLQALGMTDAFDPSRADFSGITGNRDLSISEAVHQATVTVDEQGTEAAAATALGFRASARRAGPTVTVDRPYLMLIRDQKTGAILFLGRVTDPTQTEVEQP